MRASSSSRGPLADGEDGARARALPIVDAGSQAEIHRRLADDPWVRTEQLVIASVEPWKILVGGARLESAERL